MPLKSAVNHSTTMHQLMKMCTQQKD